MPLLSVVLGQHLLAPRGIFSPEGPRKHANMSSQVKVIIDIDSFLTLKMPKRQMAVYVCII